VAGGGAFLVQLFLVKPYAIPSESMMPTIDVHQRVLVNRLGNDFGDPKVGQVLVFKPPTGADLPGQEPCAQKSASGDVCVKAVAGKAKTTFIKRLEGVGGDTIAVVHGHVIRNGKRVDEPYVTATECPVCEVKPFKVPAGTYFMMGDNRGDSDDSRYWGPVPRANIIGRAFVTYWPPKRIGGL
jgi:signal peptidase I